MTFTTSVEKASEFQAQGQGWLGREGAEMAGTSAKPDKFNNNFWISLRSSEAATRNQVADHTFVSILLDEAMTGCVYEHGGRR